jgi:hypothetical protein
MDSPVGQITFCLEFPSGPLAKNISLAWSVKSLAVAMADGGARACLSLCAKHDGTRSFQGDA